MSRKRVIKQFSMHKKSHTQIRQAQCAEGGINIWPKIKFPHASAAAGILETFLVILFVGPGINQGCTQPPS